MIGSPKLWVYSGIRPSNGAKELAAQPGFLRLRDNRLHKVKPQDKVINWGVSALVQIPMTYNVPHAIKIATDKLQAFYSMETSAIPIPSFTESVSEALSWCLGGATVVVRNKLTGHSGDGIVILEKGQVTSLSDMMKYEAPLYTRYIFKTREFRVHVVGNKVVDTQQKIKSPDLEIKNWKVRSHDNGFIFARNNIALSEIRNSLAIEATKALGLDFGAVDIIEDKKGYLYVLEVNTAPGLEGQTVQSYAKAFKELALGN